MMKIFLLISAFLTSLNVQGQFNNYQVENVGNKEGLANSIVLKIFEDSKGFLWIGTPAGLQRYDGFDFKTYYPKDRNNIEIENSYVQDIAEDKNGDLWLATRFGVMKFNTETQIFQHWLFDSTNSSDNMALTVTIVDHSKIWVGAESGNYLFSIDENKIKKFDNKLDTLKGPIMDNYVESDSSYWLIRMGHILHFNPIKNQLSTATFLNGHNRNYSTIYKAPSGKLFFCGEDLVEYSEGEMKIPGISSQMKNFLNTSHSLALNSIGEDKDGNIWLGSSKKGLFFLANVSKSSSFRIVDYSKLINNGSVNNLLIDDFDNIWTSNFQGGINKLFKIKLPLQTLKLTNNENAKNNSTNNIYAITPSKINLNIIYSGNFSECVYRINKVTNTVTKIFDGKKNNVNIIGSILEQSDGTLWLGSWSVGIVIVHPNGKTELINKNTNKYFNGWAIRDIVEDANGNIWIASFDKGLFVYQPLTKSFKNINDFLPQNKKIQSGRMWDLCIADTHTIWVATDDAGAIKITYKPNFSQIETQEYKHKPGQKNSICNNMINSVYQTKDKKIWFCTNGCGISVLDTIGNFTNYSKIHGLIHNSVHQMVQADNGDLWIATEKGLSVFDEPSNKFKSYSICDGLESDEFNPGQCYMKLENGEIWMGTSHGISIFQPFGFKQIVITPMPIITQLYISNLKVDIANPKQSVLSKPIESSHKITLDYSQNDFSLLLSSLLNPLGDKTLFSYQLLGFDKEPKITGIHNRMATYTNIAPGDYTFFLKVSDGNGGWSHKTCKLQISVLPPIWKTWWAYLVYIILSIIAIYLGRNIVVQRLKMRNELDMEKFKAEKTSELFDYKMKFFTNVSHELRTPLTLISIPLEKIYKEHPFSTDEKKLFQIIRKNVARLTNITNEILEIQKSDEKNLILIRETFELIKYIGSAIELFSSLAAEKDVELIFEKPEDDLYIYTDKIKLEKIVFNLLSNAIKFTSISGYVKLCIGMNKQDNIYTISVEDNGIGISSDKLPHIFERYFHSDTKEGDFQVNSGIGLSLTKELAEAMGGDIAVKSIEGKKTIFLVTLPLELKSKESISADDNNTYLSKPIKSEIITQVIDNTNKINMPMLLLIEDNESLLEMLQQYFGQEYRVKAYSTGTAGLQDALNTQPDIIICDINLPDTTGIEICKQLKSNTKTAHSLFIFLTAMSAQESISECYAAGADDFLTKPFNMNILEAKIKNLINTRKNIKEKFSSNADFLDELTSQGSLDEIFLNKANDVVNKHIENPDFDAEIFAKEMGISRTLLYNKIKLLTDRSVNDFVKYIRVRKAQQLLLHSGMSVSEIAYAVGFSNHSYFTKIFKEQYGVSPTQFKT